MARQMQCIPSSGTCPLMPGVSQRRFHATIQGPSAEALEILATHQNEIFHKWQRDLESLNLGNTDLLAEIPLDFARMAERVRRESYPAFRMDVQTFGGKLAQRGVRLDHSVSAINRLFEISILYLAQHAGKRATPVLALARLHALIVLLVVSGYTGEWAAGKKTLVEASLLEGEGTRHNASAYVTRVYEEERQRLSRDLHDQVGHDLVMIKLYLEMIAMDSRKVFENSKTEGQMVLPRLNEAIGLVSHAIDAVRRLVLDLGPAVFDDMGFLPAVRTYTSQFSSRT
jgi:signal transduction histidine kinase